MAQKDSSVEVVKVESKRVEIRVLNVHFVFVNDGHALRIVSKYIPDAQVYDPASFRVPSSLFNKACQQAAQILKDRQKSNSSTD